jgi:hypothetical protein
LADVVVDGEIILKDTLKNTRAFRLDSTMSAWGFLCEKVKETAVPMKDIFLTSLAPEIFPIYRTGRS